MEKPFVNKSQLLDAVKTGNVLNVAKLLGSERKNEIPQNFYDEALLKASQLGHKRIVILLLNCGANVETVDSKGKTALMLAIENKFESLVEYFLQRKVNVNVQNKMGETALFLAVKNSCSMHIVESLVKAKADVNLPNVQKVTPIMVCTEKSDLENLWFLLQIDVRLGLEDVHGRTALSRAKENGLEEFMNFLNENRTTSYVELLPKAVSTNSVKLVKIFLECNFINIHSSLGESPLVCALEKGREEKWDLSSLVDAEIIKLLIDNGVDVNATSQSGEQMPALSLASTSGRLNVVKWLVDKGADVNKEDGDGLTALMHAVNENRGEVIEFLIDRGASVNKNTNGTSALNVAIFRKNVTCVKLLIDKGAQIDQDDVRLAVIFNSIEMLRVLLQFVKASELQKDLLITALKKDRVSKDLIKLLISFGADVNAALSNGSTALCYARDAEIAELLLSKGALVNGEPKSSKSPLLHLTSERTTSDNHLEIIDVLLAKGADVSKYDFRSRTPLMIASEKNNTDLMMKLLLAKADVNQQSRQDGKTALMYASEKGNVAAVKLLIQYGVDVNAQTSSDKFSALMLASRAPVYVEASVKPRIDTIRCLLESGACADQESFVGNSAIFFTTREDIIRELVKGGANINKTNHDGNTLLMETISEGDFSPIGFLLDLGADVSVSNSKKETALSLLMDQTYRAEENLPHFERILDAGPSEICTPCCNITVAKLIVTYGRCSLVEKCLKNGVAPEDICRSCFMSHFEPRNNWRFDVIATFSPLSIALLCGNLLVARYLTENWFLTPSDIRRDTIGNMFPSLLISLDLDRSSAFLEEFLSQPFSLMKMSFSAVSCLAGARVGRKEKLAASGLPTILQGKLMFAGADYGDMWNPRENSNSERGKNIFRDDLDSDDEDDDGENSDDDDDDDEDDNER